MKATRAKKSSYDVQPGPTHRIGIMIFLFIFHAALLHLAEGLNCFSCASAEYEPLFSRNRHLRAFWDKPPKFDSICDESLEVRRLAPVESCESTCVTVFEQQFFGGVQSVPKPYTFIRGCAEQIFSLMDSRPREVDFLHQETICLTLPLSLIWPHVAANEHVEVCSCKENGCNYQVEISSSSNSLSSFMSVLLAVATTILTITRL
uniref:Protein quiver n=1 Tax=Steinernema glaseri TaxID=37863 RepID=A0A1I7ZWS9_9BILA